jgi:hypothetical protein
MLWKREVVAGVRTKNRERARRTGLISTQASTYPLPAGRRRGGVKERCGAVVDVRAQSLTRSLGSGGGIGAETRRSLGTRIVSEPKETSVESTWKWVIVFHVETHPNSPPSKSKEGKPMGLRPREKTGIPMGKGVPKRNLNRPA